jgi:hypothetical protein
MNPTSPRDGHSAIVDQKDLQNLFNLYTTKYNLSNSDAAVSNLLYLLLFAFPILIILVIILVGFSAKQLQHAV